MPRKALKFGGFALMLGTGMVSLEVLIYFQQVPLSSTLLNKAALYAAYGGGVAIAIGAVACILTVLLSEPDSKEGSGKSHGRAKKLMLYGGALTIPGAAHLALPGFAIPGPSFMPDLTIFGIILGAAMVALGIAFAMLAGVQALFETGGSPSPEKGRGREPGPDAPEPS